VKARAKKKLAYISYSLVNILQYYKYSDSMETISRTTFGATYMSSATALA